MSRPSRESIHMRTAFLWAERSEDPRLKVGCVITSGDLRRILSIGYNGPAKGLPASFIRDIPGDAGTLHAEENAIIKLDSTIPGAIMFTTDMPCEYCAQRIVNADNIVKVYYVRAYRDTRGADVLRECNIPLEQMLLVPY